MPPGVDGVRLAEGDLVAAPLPAGTLLTGLAERCWEAGAALLPVDPRLPDVARRRLLRQAEPTVVVGADGKAVRTATGRNAEPGAAVVVATSGTTGRPRLVVLGRGAVEAAVRASAERLEVTGDDPWLLCLPPAHIGGLLVLLRGLLLGVPVVSHDGFDVAAVGAATDIRCLSLVPTMLRRLVDAGLSMGHWRAALVGGDSLTAELAAAARGRGAPVVHTYGQSQSCGGIVYDGRPLPGVTVATDATGEILLGGPTLMSGYRGDPDASAAAFTGAALLRTGDVGEVDADGVLHVLGRVDDVIVTGGEKVAPAAVEALLRRHPLVADVAVVGEGDAEWGLRVVAVVVPLHAGTAPTLGSLRDLVRDSLPAYAAPRELVLVEGLPRTASGKLRREALRALLPGLRGPAAGSGG